MGQLIWSWVQYFPIMFVFYLVTDWVWGYLLKENLVRRFVKQDKEYVEMVMRERALRGRGREDVVRNY